MLGWTLGLLSVLPPLPDLPLPAALPEAPPSPTASTELVFSWTPPTPSP
jgi:hypothetical protein